MGDIFWPSAKSTAKVTSSMRHVVDHCADFRGSHDDLERGARRAPTLSLFSKPLPTTSQAPANPPACPRMHHPQPCAINITAEIVSKTTTSCVWLAPFSNPEP